MKIYEELVWRGLIQDITSPELEEKLNKGGMTFYIGTDPTGDSLHLGHYSSFLITRRLKNAGHNPIMLVGGATALIGDPRGTTERKLSDKDEVMHNFECLKNQLQKLFPYEVVNNYDWTKDLKLIDFLRDYGKCINVNYMLDKDLVRRQMESGISFTEFSYMLLQGMDFLKLHQTRGVDLQVAGSDQWGNITTGVEMTRRLTGDEVYAFTMPLITDSHGNKFGKSLGNAIWLDKNKTSPYELYQYLLNAEDEMVISYLKRLTFLTREEIEQIEKEQNQAPHLRIAQKALAKAVVTDIHGQEEYDNAVKISENLFYGNIKEIPVKDLLICLNGVPSINFDENTTLVDLLVNSQTCSSKREAREMIASKAISLNGEIVEQDKPLTKHDVLDQNVLVVRKGKKKYLIGYMNV